MDEPGFERTTATSGSKWDLILIRQKGLAAVRRPAFETDEGPEGRGKPPNGYQS